MKNTIAKPFVFDWQELKGKTRAERYYAEVSLSFICSKVLEQNGICSACVGEGVFHTPVSIHKKINLRPLRNVGSEKDDNFLNARRKTIQTSGSKAFFMRLSCQYCKGTGLTNDESSQDLLTNFDLAKYYEEILATCCAVSCITFE